MPFMEINCVSSISILLDIASLLITQISACVSARKDRLKFEAFVAIDTKFDEFGFMLYIFFDCVDSIIGPPDLLEHFAVPPAAGLVRFPLHRKLGCGCLRVDRFGHGDHGFCRDLG